MAGRGPAPKDPKLRQRRNKTATRAVVAPPEVAPVAAPEPEPAKVSRPLPPRGQPWHALTVEWWAAVWDPRKNPFADQYLETDIVGGLYRLAFIYDDFWSTGDLDKAKEIRLIESRLGLDVMARRGLQWEINEDADSRRVPANVEPPKPVDDPRRRVLQMVKPA